MKRSDGCWQVLWFLFIIGAIGMYMVLNGKGLL